MSEPISEHAGMLSNLTVHDSSDDSIAQVFWEEDWSIFQFHDRAMVQAHKKQEIIDFFMVLF